MGKGTKITNINEWHEYWGVFSENICVIGVIARQLYRRSNLPVFQETATLRELRSQ